MKVKGLSKEQTIKLIDDLKKRIEFNNQLNKFCRKFNKEHNITTNYRDDGHYFNGFHDEPTTDMVKAYTDFVEEYSKTHDMNWFNDMRSNYFGSMSSAFGGTYGPQVNNYVLNDLHDCEKHLKELESISTNNNQEEMFDDIRIERDVEHTRLNLYFDSIPETYVRELLKSEGFHWSRFLGAWTRMLNQNAEDALERIRKELTIQ